MPPECKSEWLTRGVFGGESKEEEERKKERKGKTREPKRRPEKGSNKGYCVLNVWREGTIQSASLLFVCSRYDITQERYHKAYQPVARSL